MGIFFFSVARFLVIYLFWLHQCCFFILHLLQFYIIYCSLSEKAQVEQLVRYIVEEAPEDAEKKRTFK